MPTYKDRLRGVSLSVAYAEAAAIAPVTRAMLWTYELWHPSLAEPIRFVDDIVDFSGILEDAAPRDAADLVEFIACRLTINRPEESDTAATPEVSLSREGVSGIVKQALDAARGSLIPWTLIERVYASDDPSGPAKLPVATYLLNKGTLSGTLASFSASFGDPGNVSIPRLTFRRSEYPGLA
jgi:hypothetical protein